MNTTLTRRIRLVSGLVLLAYVTSHLANLALGLASLETMDAARPLFMAIWQNPLGLLVLYGSLIEHMLLGLSLYSPTHVAYGALRCDAADNGPSPAAAFSVARVGHPGSVSTGRL